MAGHAASTSEPSISTTIALRPLSTAGGNPWISIDVVPPSDDACTLFDIEHGVDASKLETWALSPKEHGLARLLKTTLKSAHFYTSLYDMQDDQPFGISLVSRLNDFIGSSQLTKMFDGLVGYTVRNAALYIDSWDDACHQNPNFYKYKQFGLIPTPLGYSFDSRVVARKQLIRILSSAIFIDRILASELFYISIEKSLTDVEYSTRDYVESPETLIPMSHWVYQTHQTFPSGTVGRACQQALNWRIHFQELPKPIKKGQIEPTFDDFGKVPNKLLKDMIKADQRAAEGIAQGNISRCAIMLLTTWGQTNVSQVDLYTLSICPYILVQGNGDHADVSFPNFETLRPIEAYRSVTMPKNAKKGKNPVSKSQPSNKEETMVFSAEYAFYFSYIAYNSLSLIAPLPTLCLSPVQYHPSFY